MSSKKCWRCSKLMPETRLTAKRVTAFLQHLTSLVEVLPTQQQKVELQHELNAIIAFLRDFKERLAELPTREDEEGLKQSLEVLRHFVTIAESDPVICRTLGLTPRRTKSSSSVNRRKIPLDHKVIVEELNKLSADDIRTMLTDRTKGWTVADLKQIAGLMGLRVRSRATRATIVDLIVKRTENQEGYEYLRRHA